MSAFAMGLPIAVGAFLSYAAASALFWNFPNLLHKKKNIVFSCAHISHRGGNYLSNTTLHKHVMLIIFRLKKIMHIFYF